MARAGSKRKFTFAWGDDGAGHSGSARKDWRIAAIRTRNALTAVGNSPGRNWKADPLLMMAKRWSPWLREMGKSKGKLRLIKGLREILQSCSKKVGDLSWKTKIYGHIWLLPCCQQWIVFVAIFLLHLSNPDTRNINIEHDKITVFRHIFGVFVAKG